MKLCHFCIPLAKVQIRDVTPRPTWIPTNFGGINISQASNIIFSNGLLDPWHATGSVTKSLSPSLVAINIPAGPFLSPRPVHMCLNTSSFLFPLFSLLQVGEKKKREKGRESKGSSYSFHASSFAHLCHHFRSLLEVPY